MNKPIIAAAVMLGVTACSTTGKVDVKPKLTPTFSVGDVSVPENAGVASVTLTKAGNNNLASTLSYSTSNGTAVAGEDFEAKTGTVSVAATQNSVTLPIKIYDDNKVEPSENFTIKFNGNRNAKVTKGTSIVTITDNDVVPTKTCDDGTVIPDTQVCPAPPTKTCEDGTIIPDTQTCPPLAQPVVLTVQPTSVDETAGTVSVSVLRTGDLSKTTSFDWRTYDGTAKNNINYTAKSGGLSFNPGQTVNNYIKVPVFSDGKVTGDLNFGIHITPKDTATTVTNDGNALVSVIDKDTQQNTKICRDGTVVLNTAICPQDPSPQPGGIDSGIKPPLPAGYTEPQYVDGYLKSPRGPLGDYPIATTDHDVMQDITTNSRVIPPMTGDTVGAFRFICRHTNLLYDDPTVAPGKPGKSHLHDFTSNYTTDAYSTYASLRQAGGSGCNDVAGFDNDPTKVNFAGNRTPYWQPALLDGKGNVIVSDYTVFYYKREPMSSPECQGKPSGYGSILYPKGCVPLPNGIKFIFGADPSNPTQPYRPNTSHTDFLCIGNNGGLVTNFKEDMKGALTCAAAGANGPEKTQFEVRNGAPACWDGINLDSPDHRSHLSYAYNTNVNGFTCGAEHPYKIPTFTYGSVYTILPTDDVTKIHFASDESAPDKPAGWSFHVDYGPASWDPIILDMWTKNCIDGFLSCQGGELGGGYKLKAADVPRYLINGQYISAWRNPVRLVPVPPRPNVPAGVHVTHSDMSAGTK